MPNYYDQNFYIVTTYLPSYECLLNILPNKGLRKYAFVKLR